MPLLRGIARTAVVAGTATAVSNRVSRRQAGRWSEQSSGAPQQAPQPAPTGTDTNTKLAQLRELGQLHTSGVLDDAEFELQKSQILNS
jgi:hypothetical protein